MKKILSYFLFISFLFSCQPEGRVYVEHEKLSPDVEWLKEDSREFTIPIENKDQTYKLSIAFRYANGYQFRELKVNVTETSPSGIEKRVEYTLPVRNENGEYIGDAGYDIWDTEHVVEASKTFSEKGTYTYRIEHNMPQDPLYFAMEIGMILDKK